MGATSFIAVGYDGSPYSGEALRWAAEMAVLRHEQIVVVLVVDPRDEPRGPRPETWWEEVEDGARAVLARVAGAEYRLERRLGNKATVLAEAAHEASMLVVGSHGHSLAGEVFLGSVSQTVARHATSPVVVVREPRTRDSGRVVVGFDDQDRSRRAFEFACRVAELTGDKVVALRSCRPVTIDRYGYAPLLTSMDEQETVLHDTVVRLGTDHPTVGVRSHVVDAPPARALVDASASAALVVVGARDHHAVTDALLGSVTHDVLHRAHCTVAVVK